MDYDRILGQASVAVERVFDLFLGGCIPLPIEDFFLEHFCP